MAFDLIVRNGTLVTSAGRAVRDIAISDGRVADVSAGIAATAADEIDAQGLFVVPGLIDAHVHFREPGLEYEETWLTGTRAAVMGGVTTVLDMPNTVPPTDTVDRARAKLALATSTAYCDFGIFGLLGELEESVAELASSGLIVGLKAFMGPTTGNLRAPDDDGLRRALRSRTMPDCGWRFTPRTASLIESSEATLRGAAGRTDALAHLESRPAEAEVAAIDRAARLLHETGASGHILHLSSAAGLAAVERWRAAGVDLTCEVTPHHLFLDRDVYATAGGVARVNPPIRGGEDATALRAALADGRIDYVATDHAPHLRSGQAARLDLGRAVRLCRRRDDAAVAPDAWRSTKAG